MKIEVRDEKDKPLGAIKINVVDLDVKEATKKKTPAWQRIIELALLKIMDPSALSSEKESKDKVKSASQKNHNNVKTIEIRVSLPAFASGPSFKAAWLRLRYASRQTLSAITLVVLLIIVGFYSLLTHTSTGTSATAASDAVAKPHRPQLQRGTPKYATLLPAGKSIDQLGGWARVSPANRAPVYAYADSIGAVRIDVSEQPLPSSFIGDPNDQLAKLARNFNANEKLNLFGTVVYIATSSDGSQYLLLTKKNLLILVSSNGPLTNNQWAAYINSLH